MLSYLAQGLLLGSAAAVQPGSFQALLLSLSLSGGWRRAVPAAFAPLISDSLILILVLVVLTQLPSWFVSVLQIGGGLFLLFLSWSAYRAVQAVDETIMENAEPPGGDVLKAAITNLLNPNPYIFWATVGGPILITAWNQAPINAIAFLTGMYVALIGGMVILVLLFSAAGQIGKGVNRTLGWLSALALLAFGLYQLVRGAGTLMTVLS